jgi:CRISPR-associated protein Csm1
MNAGGKFTILAHKLNKEDKEKLENIKRWVNNEFMEVNFLSTKFVIKSIDFEADMFKLGKFSEVYKKLALAFEEEKLRFVPEFNQFDEYLEKAKNGVCELCGIVPIEGKDNVCKYCKLFEELGSKLVRKNYKYINFNLDSLFSIDISDKPDKLFFGFETYPIKRVANVVPVFDKEELNAKKYKLLDKSDIDAKENQIKSFYHIAVDGLKEESGEFYGRKYLAVLKADIDNLGKIFICGFKGEETFSRILYLSRMIDYFFTNILMEYVKNKNIYTVFAGGDDLFLIGHYEDIVNVYKFVIREFKNYTKNDDFHLSASIKLFRPNVPVHLVAEFAEEALDDAKKEGKDSVSVFDIVYKNKEFLEFLKLREFFESLYKKLKKVNSGSSFMYKFYDFIEMSYKVKNGEDVVKNSRWIYLMRYMIEKNFEVRKNDKNAKTKKEIKNMLYDLKKMIEKDDIKLVLPLNLFMYSIRKY